MTKEVNNDQKICIIGAGPSGLSAAEALKNGGFKNITILEKRNRVGGQAYTRSYQAADHRNIIYDLGSLQPFGFHSGDLNKLFQKYDIHFGRGTTAKHPLYFKIYSLIQRKYLMDFTQYKLGIPLTISQSNALIQDLFAMLSIAFTYSDLNKVGFNSISPDHLQELSKPMNEWLREKNSTVLGDNLGFLLGNILTGSNFSKRDEISALYFVKFFQSLIHMPFRYIDGSYMPVQEGYGELWERISKNHQVILGAKIKAITRSTHGVKVELDNQTFEFDSIILACNANEILKILDLSPEEQTLFEKVKYSPIWRGAFLAKNLPTDGGYAITEPYQQPGYFPCISAFIPEDRVENDVWLYQAVLSGGIDDFTNIKSAAQQVLKEHFNGEIVEWLDLIYWPEYMPHFLPEVLKEGIYNQIDSLQGKNHTFFLNEIISGGSHALVADYVNKFIKERFSK